MGGFVEGDDGAGFGGDGDAAPCCVEDVQAGGAGRAAWGGGFAVGRRAGVCVVVGSLESLVSWGRWAERGILPLKIWDESSPVVMLNWKTSWDRLSASL